MPEIVVLGSGIVGLYTTYSLIKFGNVTPSNISVIAEHLPGDQSTNYTSPWAGGNFSCISPADELTLASDKFTYTNLKKLQADLGGAECGLQKMPTTEYWDFVPPKAKIDSLKTYLEDFRVESGVPEGAQFGISYTTWNFNCPLFLQNFQAFLEKLGVKFSRRTLSHISQAFLNSDTKYVFNCTGIGARHIGGVEDTNVYPARGQVVVVKAPHIKMNRTRWGKDSATYIIPRPFSGDSVVLGGFLQKDNWTGDCFKFETEDILKRTTQLMPELLHQDFEIIRVAAGLRPSRHGGTRIEKQELGDGKAVIHNYGAGGYGYQSGLGMAFNAVSLLRGSKL